MPQLSFFALALATAIAVPEIEDNAFLLQVLKDLQSFLIVWMFFRDADKSYIKRIHERLDKIEETAKKIRYRQTPEAIDTDLRE